MQRLEAAQGGGDERTRLAALVDGKRRAKHAVNWIVRIERVFGNSCTQAELKKAGGAVVSVVRDERWW